LMSNHYHRLRPVISGDPLQYAYLGTIHLDVAVLNLASKSSEHKFPPQLAQSLHLNYGQ
jgi:hypothetical protein